MSRKIAALVAGALALLVVAGCGPFIKSFTIAQQAVSGPVRVTLEFCDDNVPDCGGPIGGSNQILAAYAIPEDADVRSVKTTGTKDLTLVESASYTEWLEANVDRPEGLRWVGFRSGLVGDVTGRPNLWTLVAEFQPGAREEPASTFPYVALLKYRNLSGLSEDDPVACDGPVCPTIGTDYDGIPVDLDGELPIRDVGLPRKQDGGTLDRGTRAELPVAIRYAGATGSGELTPAVATTIPGATVTAPKVEFATTGERAVPVTLDVPEATAPGDYEISVVLLGRATTIPVHVDAPPVPVLDVASVAFPETRVGRANGPRNVLVTNSGTRALDMRRSEVTGAQAGEFRIAADECAGRTLRPGRDCIVALEFGPRAGGERTASLRIPNAYRDVEVPLSGSGAVVPGHRDVFVALGALRITTASRRQLADDMALLFEQDFLMRGDVSWRLRYRGRLLGAIRKRPVEAPGTQQVRLAITPAGLRALRRGSRHLVLTTALTDADGRRSVVRRMVKLDD